MHTVKYIFYRFYNAISLKFRFFVRYGVVYLSQNIEHRDTTVFFDFSDPTTHLGDRLFYIPLIEYLYNNSIKVVVSPHDFITQKLLKKITGIDLDVHNDKYINTIKVIPIASYSRLRDSNSVLAVVNLSKCECKPHLQLISDFKNILKLNQSVEKWSVSPFQLHNQIIDNNAQPIIVFNNYISSGGFRKYFIDERKLIDKCKWAKQHYNAIVYHVGSAHDALTDNKIYDFVDHDIRGTIAPDAMIDIVSSKSVVSVITYDNFLMHLAGMYSKKAYVMFRGRVLRKSRAVHNLYINCCFFENDDQISYIR